MLTFIIILGFVMLIGAALNEAKHTGSRVAKVLAFVLIVLFLIFLIS